VTTGEVTKVLECDPYSDKYLVGFREHTSLSPDGKYIVFVLAEYAIHNRETKTPTFSDRRDVVYCYNIETRTMKEVQSARADVDGIAFYRCGFDWRALWSPDSRKFAFTQGRVIKEDPAEPFSPGICFNEDGTVARVPQGYAEPSICICDVE
jgi:Tol biopolymer transport system component